MKSIISILIPCFNEAANIGALFDRLLPVTTACSRYSFSYLFVDDGSRDDTVERIRAEASARGLKEVTIVELSRNFGKESALTAGLDFVKGDACIILDADLQDPPEVIPRFLKLWEEGYEVVATRRDHRPVDTALKKVGTRAFYLITNLVSDITIPANVGDARLIDTSVVEALRRLPENRRFMKGLFAWVGFRTAFVDVSRPPRHKGESTFNYIRYAGLAINGIVSFTPSLLRLWSALGVLISMYALLHGTYIIARVLVKGVELPGYASLAVLVLFLSGVQMIGLGLIGEYVGSTYYEAKRRPSYIVRRVHGAGGEGTRHRSAAADVVHVTEPHATMASLQSP
jgi:glycosyltransferase involved in cell wall biosynthesis